MVNMKQIHKLLKKHFKILGDVQIDAASGQVHVTGDVTLNSQLPQLPVQFGHVGGDFNCSHNQLTSLQGAPGHVGGDFYCRYNPLTSLQGAPDHVGGGFYCHDNQLTSLQGAPGHVGGDFYCRNNQLTSLQGAPGHVGHTFSVTYNDHLPVLRLLQYQSVRIWGAPQQLEDIMSKYAGKGKSHALNCALELKQAGYGSNAKW